MKQIANTVQAAAARIKAGNGYPIPQPEKVSPKDVVRISDLDTSYHPLVKEAVGAAYEWVQRKKTQPNASLVLVASPVMIPDPRNPGQQMEDEHRTGYGVGKTHIAKSIMWSQRIVRDDDEIVGHCGRFFMAADLMDLMRGGERGNAPEELAPGPVMLWDGLHGGVHAVVIDDVGTEGTLEYIGKENQKIERQVRYFRFIDYCYTTGISVIITANMTLDQLATHLGGRCWSRLLEMAPAGFMIDMTGVPDYRRKSSGR